MSEGNKKNKRKIEHWELVSLLLMVYDFIAILVSYLERFAKATGTDQSDDNEN